jgi:hypothetical protein
MRRPFVHLLALLATLAALAACARSAHAAPGDDEVTTDGDDDPRSPGPDDLDGRDSINWTAVGCCSGGVLGFAVLLVGYAYVPGWWRRRGLRKGPLLGRGDTARTARPAKSRADAERDVLSRKCACGAKLAGPLDESAWSTIALGETTVTVARAPCACGSAVRRYYLLPEDDGL